MPAVAEVQFKAAGSQQVVSAFNSVGTAAQTSSTKVQQSSTAISSLGKGMKSSVASIGQVTTAFATLSLSIVNTYRSYRDLGDAQLQVDRANLKVSKTQNAIRLLEKDIAKDRKAAAKGSLDYAIASNKIVQAEQKLAKDRKDGKHTAAELKGEELAIAKMRKEGVGNTQQLSDKETKLQLLREQLGVATTNAGEAQERFNDIQQNFYLSIAPLAISTIGTLTTAFSGLKGMLTGGGGLIGGLGPIGLILGGLSLAILAFKTNFLGLRDAVGGVIDWLKERFGVWKQTIEDVFNLIRKGEWGAAFNKIKEAAAKFWEDLKNSNPFFGGVAILVDQIKHGKWGDAFNTIRNAAVFFWTELKKAIPLFGTIETVIKNISQGKWEEAFKTIGDSIMKGLQSILGADLTEKIVLKLQLMKDSAYAELNLMKEAFTKKGGPIDLINQGLAKLGGGDVIGGFSQIWTGLDKAIGIFITRVNDWVKLNFGIDLVALGQQANAIGVKILDGIKGGLTFVARTWIDPVLAQLLDPQVWIQGFIAMGGFFVKIGTALYTAIGTALGNVAKDPKGAATWWGDLGNGIWTGLSTWFSTNLPSATKAMQALAQSLTEAVEAAKTDLGNVGIAMWNAIIEGIRTLTGGGASPFGGALDALKKSPIDLPVKPVVTPEGETAIQTWVKNANPLEYPTEPDQSVMKKNLNTQLGKVFKKGGYVVPKIDVDADTKLANQKARAQVNAINNMHATIKVSARATGGAFAGLSGGVHLNQHGYQGTVKRPTAFIAGEGGRPEDVTVRPRGSAQRGGSGGGGGGSTHITVSFEPEEFAQFIRYRINDNQGVVK
jgi:hypothetical protein